MSSSWVPNERTKIDSMTDGDEYLQGAEKYEGTIRILQSLPANLRICRAILRANPQVEEDSKADNDLCEVAQDIILIIQALETVEDLGIWDALSATKLGKDLDKGMNDAKEYIVKHRTFIKRPDHEIGTKAMELVDIVSRFLYE